MARHRRLKHDEPSIAGAPGGDTVPVPGHARWADLIPTSELPLVINDTPRTELVRPYVVPNERRDRWFR